MESDGSVYVEEPEIDQAAEIQRFLAMGKAKCESDFFAFCRICFPHICKVKSCEMHEEIIGLINEKVDSKGDNYFAFAAPRDFAKSTLCSVLLPIWLLLTRRKRFIVLISAVYEQSINFISSIRTELETNEMIQAFWGDTRGSIWQSDRITTSWNAMVIARGITGSFRGLNYLGQRPDAVICDDIETDESVLSRDRTQGILGTIKKVIMSLGKDLLLIVVGTIMHYDSVMSILTDPKRVVGFVSRKFKCKKNMAGSNLLSGQSIWEEYHPTENLNKKILLLGPSAASQELFNDPIGDGVTPFKWDWIRFDRQPPLNIKGIVQACDLSTGESADFFVHVTVALDNDNNFHILELRRGKYEMQEQVELISQCSVMKWRGHTPDCVVIETNAYQVVLAQHLRGLLPIPISRENHNRAKVNRIMSLEPWFANAKVYVPEDAPWIEDFRTEYVRWRQIDNIQDDQLDAVQMAIKKLSQLYGATSIEAPKAGGKHDGNLIVAFN